MNQFNESGITILLPPHLQHLPVKIVRGGDASAEGISVTHTLPIVAEPHPHLPTDVLVWYKDEYTKLSMDEILWIKADRSYSTIYATRDRKFTISFSLASVERCLPMRPFLRIHRSYMVNSRHITGVVGNRVRMGEKEFVIGSEYRHKVRENFVFIGVKKMPKHAER